MNKLTFQMIERLKRYGISETDAYYLRRIAMTLHRWHERECNGEVERDEATGETYKTYTWMREGDRRLRDRCPDYETGALKRLASVMASYPLLAAYVQGDPRGAPLYIYERERLPIGTGIDSCYSSIGAAVHS
jgi:hypothetical protein